MAKALAPLTPVQVLWLAASIATAQLPHLAHLPLWLGLAGLAATALRVVLLRSHRAQPPAWLLLLAGAATAAAARWHFGYFAARDPCVAFLYVLVALKLL